MLSGVRRGSQSLSGAIRVNPWNTDELASAIHDALTLTRVERELQMGEITPLRLHKYGVVLGSQFVDEFRDVCEHPAFITKIA